MTLLNRSLAAVLAAVSAVTPAVSFGQDKKPSEPVRIAQDFKVSAPKFPIPTPSPNTAPTAIRQASDYSEQNKKEVGIAIFKGTENESNLTGESIGKTLSALFKKHYGTDSKVFLSPADSDANGKFTRVYYLVNGNLNGPYSLNQAVIAQSDIARTIQYANTSSLSTPAGNTFAGKVAHEPQ